MLEIFPALGDGARRSVQAWERKIRTKVCDW